MSHPGEFARDLELRPKLMVEAIKEIKDPASGKTRQFDVQNPTYLQLRQEYQNLFTGESVHPNNQWLQDTKRTVVPLE